MALVQKAFSDIITFSRSSNATRVGPTGLVEYAPHNLLLQSQTLDNVAWGQTNLTVTANAAAAPDGTVTADKLIPTVTDSGFVSQTITVSASTPYAFSVFAKAAELSQFQLVSRDLPNAVLGTFDLLNGTATLGSGGSAVSILPVGGGWFRCIAIYTSTGSGTNRHRILPLGTANSISGILAWGAQLAVGPYALDYTPTTTAAVYGPRFDFDGSGVTSVDPIARNLVLYSEQFDDAAWTKGANVTVTANAAAAPDGTVTADLVVSSASADSSTNQVFQQATVASSQTYTASFWVQAAGANQNIAIRQTANGVLVTSTTVAVTSTWQRVSVTFTASTNPGFAIRPDTVSNLNIYVWGAQLELGSTATGYMPSGATNGFRAVPVVSGSATARGLLVEEQRTNLVTYSEQFDNAAWTKNLSSVTANSVSAPDGTVTGDKLVEDTSTGVHYLNVVGTLTGSTAYSISVYAKAGERSRIQIAGAGGAWGSSATATFDLSAGTVVSTNVWSSSSISAVGNGWYRCSVTGTTVAVPSSAQYLQLVLIASGTTQSYAGNGTSGLFIWGAQLEAGAFATSYIPTVASTVTRSADVASVNTLSPWFNATEGTLYAEWTPNGLTGSRAVASANDGTSSELIEIRQDITDGNFLIVDSTTQANIGLGALTAGSTAKVAGAYKLNDVAAVLNGGTVQTDTAATLPTVTALELGARGGVYLSGHLRRVAFYPRRLSNSEIDALTS